ncbi:MAG: serine/threonine-protein phosphatase [Firmicutes bacterium]|nr:serine/threonine-protein phosphatase [Bacillota bacterium]
MKNKKYSIIIQVAILFLAGTIITGLLSFYNQRVDATRDIKLQTEDIASNVAAEVEMALKEYPTYDWLIKYWYDNYENMDIEYDVDYSQHTQTEEKYRVWKTRHPLVQLKYATAEEINAMEDYDQKLFAEIAYSWFITRINQIKKSCNVAFLFCVLPNEAFDSQFFLFSAADPDSIRGTSYEEVYPIGISVKVDESQAQAMKSAVNDSSYLADAGDYVDYYAHIGNVDDRPVLIGLTYDLTYIKDSIERQARHKTALAVAYQTILSLICLGIIYGFVLRPLKNIQENIRLYKNSKDSKAVQEGLSSVRIQNEMKYLADDVVDLAEEMDAYTLEIEEITKEKERIGTELDLATKIQASMLPNQFPPFPDRKEFDIYASMDPAKEVGGDFYDFFFIDPDHICLAIADVSGKGIPGALFMMSSKIMIESKASPGKTPAEILTDVNDTISKNNQAEMFVTMWLGILEISTGRIIAANAGHEYPSLMKNGQEFQLIKDKHGFVLGGMEGLKYKDYEIELQPGDKLFVYTDGVPEAANKDNELYGTERMLKALNESRKGGPKEILQGVRKSVDDFVEEAEQFDDLTMMCIEYKGNI